MFVVDLGCYMKPLHFNTLQKAQEFCNRILKEEKIVLSIVEEKGDEYNEQLDTCCGYYKN